MDFKLEEDGTIVSPKGFKAASTHIGLKKVKKDLVLISSKVPATAAACFTKNIVKAAPVLWDEKLIVEGKEISAIIINSGNANACTGEQGLIDTEEMAKSFAKLLDKNANEVMVCSTGVIGVNLPMDKVKLGIEKTFPLMGYSKQHGIDAAEGIITTDTFVKKATIELEIDNKKVTISGMAKGSGMIEPNMATMLSFLTTDISISKELLQKALSETVEDTYNMISVDGDTSTNDTVIILANALAGNEKITDENSSDYLNFKKAVFEINRYLAKQVARDGEGATKFMEVFCFNSKTETDARKIVKSVISSNLFKAALFGADANWGRILCAMGYSGGEFEPLKVTISIKSLNGEIILMEEGKPLVFDEATAKKILSEKDIFVFINLNNGTETATAWGCDLTYDYVKINGDYRS